jgi:hypothetical protein
VRLLSNASLIDLALVVVVFLSGLIAGWRSAIDYANAMVLGGALIIGVGALSAVGSAEITRDFSSQMGQSVGVDRIPHRTQRTLTDTIRSLGFLVDTVVAGMPLILVGKVLKVAFE